MSFINRKVMGQVQKASEDSTKELTKNLLILQENLKQVQENQVEFEKYLKEILKYVKRK